MVAFDELLEELLDDLARTPGVIEHDTVSLGDTPQVGVLERDLLTRRLRNAFEDGHACERR